MPLPVSVPYVAKSSSQQPKKRMDLLEQWMRSHPLLTAALGAVLGVVFTSIMAPIVLLFVGNPFAEPDVTVAGNFGSGFPGQDVYPVVVVHNAGEATAETCHVEVTDMQTQKDFWGPTIFSIPPNQEHIERLEFQAPKLPKGQTWDIREYRIRAVCDNGVSPDSYTIMKVY
jgi:hypothetical protein